MPQGNLPEKEVLPKTVSDPGWFSVPGAHDPAVAVMKTKPCFKRRATAVLSGLDCSSTAARH